MTFLMVRQDQTNFHPKKDSLNQDLKYSLSSKAIALQAKSLNSTSVILFLCLDISGILSLALVIIVTKKEIKEVEKAYFV